MCGIAGVISLGRPLQQSDYEAGRAMTGLLHHRGPDSRGELFDERCYLGNSRLSIIDLSSNGDLPMKSDDDAVWLCYNGEVTNFREIEASTRLRDRFRFHSTSDSETILHLYEEKGTAFLGDLSGMFAFCVYDRRAGRVLIVRDFFGTRPLFTMRLGDRFYFASEIKAFFGIPGFRPRASREAVFHYFSLAYVPGTLTAFDGISEVDGGHLVEIDLEAANPSPRVSEYYRIRFDTDDDMTMEEADEGFFEAIRGAVERNLISDAPVGVTLSGGLDSSSVLGLARHLGRSSELHSFSLRINEKSFDESCYQRLMASYSGSIHHEIMVNPGDVEQNIHRHIAFMDEPIGDGSAIPFFLLAREARKFVKVLLSGEGGDEISNAYETHMACRMAGLYRRMVPRPIRMLNLMLASHLPVSYRKLSFDFLAKRFTRGAEMSVPDAHLHWRHVLEESQKRALMPGSSFRPTESFFEEMYDNAGFDDDLDRIALIDLKYFFIGDLMLKNDRMVMAHSVEARFPFVDRKAFEFFARIPPRYKIRGFTRRYIEKRSMARVLPPRIRRRQNFGIELPYSYWFEGELRHIAETYFTRERVESTGFLSWPEVEAMWKQHLSRRRDNGRALWCLLTLLIWHDLFIESDGFRSYLA